MVVFVISGASYGLGPELVCQASCNDQNIVFALVRSPKVDKRLADVTITRNNIYVYFETQEDHQTGYEVRPKTSLDRVSQCLTLQSSFRTRFTHQMNHMNNLQQFFANHVLDAIQITNAFTPLLDRGSPKKVITLTSQEPFNSRLTMPSGLDVGVAYAMAKTALEIAVLRYSAIPEYKQKGFVYAIVESSSLFNPEEKGVFLS
ncbi:NAD(P)H-binding, partial [Rhizoctonia solani]